MKTIVLYLLVCQVSVFGQDRIYTFSGHVTDISQDAAGIIGASGIRVGDVWTASFFVDLGRPGTYTQKDGTVVVPHSDPHDTIQCRYYYDQLLSDLPIHERDGGSFNRPQDVASWNYAYDNFGIAQSFDSLGILQGGSDNAWVTIAKSDWLDATIATWEIGDLFEGNAWACDDQYRFSDLKGTLTLASIQTIPEPSVWVLSTVGLLLFVRIKRLR